MKRILSLLVCMCLVLGSVTFTASAATLTPDEPSWSATANTFTKIADYGFAADGISGTKVSDSLSSMFNGDYTAEGGYRMTVMESATNSKGNSSKDGWIQIDFPVTAKDTAAGTETYMYGLSGTYAIDMTINSNLNKTQSVSGNRARIDAYFGEGTIDSNPTLYSSHRFNSADTSKSLNNWQILPVISPTTASGGTGNTLSIPLSTDCLVRFVINTSEEKIALYAFDGSDYKYYDTVNYEGGIIKSLFLQPRKFFEKDTYIEFKNVKIYEVQKNDEANVNKFVASLPDSVVSDASAVTENISLPALTNGTWISSNTAIISNDGTVSRPSDTDTEVVLTAKYSGTDAEAYRKYKVTVTKSGGGDPNPPIDPSPDPDPTVIDFTKEFPGGVKVGDYTFTGSNIPGEYVIGTPSEYKTEYVPEGLKITKITPEADNSENSSYTAIKLVANLSDDNTYQYGFSGKYVVDIKFNMKGKTTFKNAARWDCNFMGENSNINTSAGKEYNEFRLSVSSAGTYSLMLASSVTGKSADGPNKSTNISGETDTVVRFVIDTQAKKIDAYVNKGDGNYQLFYGNCEYLGDIIQAIKIRPRLAFDDGSYVIYKGIKIYEIEKAEGVLNTEVESSKSQFPSTIVPDPLNVTENINVSGLGLTSLNPDIMTNDGVITRGYDDEDVALQASYTTTAIPNISLYKCYNLVVKARDDISITPVVKNDYKTDEGKKTVLAATSGIEQNSSGIKAAKGEEDNSFIGIFKAKVNEDSDSKTFISNYRGVYDFEIDYSAIIQKKKADAYNTAQAKIQAGYYDFSTGNFTPYANISLYNDGAYFATNAVTSEEYVGALNTNNTVKFRFDTKNKTAWIWQNGKKLKSEGTLYKADNEYVNAYRVVTYSGAENGDYVLTAGSELTSYFKLDNFEVLGTEFEKAMSAAAIIPVSDVISNPQNAYGAMGALPKTVNGMMIKWSSDSDCVDIDEKYVYASDTDKNVTVTAKVYDESCPEVFAEKAFTLTLKATTDVEKLVESQAKDLRIEKLTNQNPEAIIGNLNLPASIPMGNTITWKSSDPSIISEAGKINKNIDIPENKEVKLTASISGTSITKDIAFKVAKRGADVTVYNNTADVTTPINGVVTYKALISGSGTTVLADSNGSKIISVDSNGTSITFNYGGGSYTLNKASASLEFVMNSIDKKLLVYDENGLVLDYVPYLENAQDFASATSSATISQVNVVLDEYALYNYNIDKYNYFDALGNCCITNSVVLPNSSIGGVNVKWSTSNSSLLSETGEFNAPMDVEFVELTLRLDKQGGSGAFYEKTITCAAIPASKMNLFTSSAISCQGTSTPAGAYKPSSMIDGDFNNTLFKGTFKPSNQILIDMKTVQDISSVFIAQNGMTSCDVYVSADNINWSFVGSSGSIDAGKNYCMISFNPVDAQYVKINNINYTGDSLSIYEIAGYVQYSESNLANKDLELLVMPENYTLTESSITLPGSGSYGSVITWTSSHPNIISADGKITTPTNSTEVKLTAKAVNGSASATRSFLYFVEGAKGGAGGSPAGGGGLGGSSAGITSSTAFPTTNTGVTGDAAKPYSLFSDVTSTAWYYTYVADLKNANIINGDSNNRFNPNSSVKREEFVKMLVMAKGISLSGTQGQFTDVAPTDWFAPYVNAAKESGLVSGIGDGIFGAGYDISRQDMAVMLYNIISVNNEGKIFENKFADDGEISDYAHTAVYTMKELGIISGYTSGNFNPKGQLTRAEAAKVISVVRSMF